MPPINPHPLIKEYLVFLKEYRVTSLALGIIMGTAATTLVNSLVKDIIMPLLSPLGTEESWRQAVWAVAGIELRIGSFLAELLNFAILGFIVFLVAKKVLKEEKVGKK